jgi:hypothetical protein
VQLCNADEVSGFGIHLPVDSSIGESNPGHVSVRLVDGLMWMGWDGLHFVDGMAHIMLIPHFVWLVESEGWDGKCLAYNL